MISNHVTYFILFHWSDIGFFSFCFLSSFSLKSSLASQNAFLLVWILHRSSSWTTLVYILFYFILFMGGLFVCWGAGRSLLPLPPSPSLPWLSRSYHFNEEHRSFPVPVLHSLVWLVPVWMCSLVHHALLRSISLALTVLLRAGENKQKG